VVDVGEEYRERLPPAPCPGDREVGLALPGACVQHACLGIGARLCLELRVEQAALQQYHWRQRDHQQQRTERAGDRDQDAHAGLGQVEQHPLAVPEHVDQPGVRVDEPGGDRHQAGVEHAEGDGAAHRHARLLRAHQPRVGAWIGQPDGGLAHRCHLGDQPEQRGGACACQAERGAAERPAVHRGAPHPQVNQQAKHGGRGERVQRREQQRHRDPPGGQQVAPDPGGLP
jgi:hypothetical protein